METLKRLNLIAVNVVNYLLSIINENLTPKEINNYCTEAINKFSIIPAIKDLKNLESTIYKGTRDSLAKLEKEDLDLETKEVRLKIIKSTEEQMFVGRDKAMLSNSIIQIYMLSKIDPAAIEASLSNFLK